VDVMKKCKPGLLNINLKLFLDIFALLMDVDFKPIGQ